MDTGSQHLLMAFEALIAAQDQLRSFGYRLYLDTKARSWTQPKSITLYRGHPHDRPDLHLGLAIWRDRSGERSVSFTVSVNWDENHWSVQSCVENEDVLRDTITDTLWESPAYRATTLEDLVAMLERAVHELTSSIHDLRVAACLATIQRGP
jgi:hypothetical protein